MKETIDINTYFADPKKGEMKMGTIVAASRIKTGKMFKLIVQFEETDIRQVITNIGNDKFVGLGERKLEGSDLVGKELPFVTNLEPATISGFHSGGMIHVNKNADGEIDLNDKTYNV